MRTFTAAIIAICAVGCGESQPAAPSRPDQASPITVGPGGAHSTIQAALDVAPEGAVIAVSPGVYPERLVIRRAVTLRGSGSVLDGSAAGGNGKGIGIEILASGAEVSGFLIQNYERGIVLDGANRNKILGNEIRANISKDIPPLNGGITWFDGVVLFGSHDNEIAGNFIHDNGHSGVFLTRSSNGNIIRANRIASNGAQQVPGFIGIRPEYSFHGKGIFTTGTNNINNQFADNEVSGNHWGIYINGGADTGNVIRNNQSHGNLRAGIAIRGTAQGNRVEGNDATGNGLTSLDPSFAVDMFESMPIDNQWTGNRGTTNFATTQGASAWGRHHLWLALRTPARQWFGTQP